jgi:hypothetical protein
MNNCLCRVQAATLFALTLRFCEPYKISSSATFLQAQGSNTAFDGHFGSPKGHGEVGARAVKHFVAVSILKPPSGCFGSETAIT